MKIEGERNEVKLYAVLGIVLIFSDFTGTLFYKLIFLFTEDNAVIKH